MIESKLRITDDGSHTMFSHAANESYHSSFGAIQESAHIFIAAGIDAININENDDINILEVGTGTGLNALLTYLWAAKHNHNVSYTGFEPNLITQKDVSLINYPELLHVSKKIFVAIHNTNQKPVSLSEYYTVLVKNEKIENATLKPSHYNVIFFDAFSPGAQPELWTADIFLKLYNALKKGGVLTTYSSKGTVKRALKQVGFSIEKIPGPPGKREFLRAWKI